VVALGVGFGLVLGIINIFIRDIGEVMSIVIQFWFWLTPIVYTISIMGGKVSLSALSQPMTGVVNGFSKVFLLLLIKSTQDFKNLV